MSKSLKDLDTKLEVIRLNGEGYSGYQIAEMLGIPARTIQAFMAKDTWKEFWNTFENLNVGSENSIGSFPKVLFLDLEVSASIVAAFSMFKHFSTPDHIIEFPYVLTYAYNWLHEPEDKVYSKTLADYPIFNFNHKNDKQLIEDLWEAIDQADLVVAQNAMFDVGWFTQRLAYHNLPEPSPYRVVCTLKGLKKAMSMPSNSLGYTTKYFNLGVEKLHNDGIALWIRCMNGEVDALRDMETYNRGDIPTLRQLYLKIRSYIPNHPNLAIYYPKDGTMRCGVCGGNKLALLENKAYTNLSNYKSYRCEDCGSVRRTQETDLTAEDRKLFTRTIVK